MRNDEYDMFLPGVNFFRVEKPVKLQCKTSHGCKTPLIPQKAVFTTYRGKVNQVLLSYKSKGQIIFSLCLYQQ